MAPKHDADHGEADEGGGTAEVTLVVAWQPAMMPDPSERSVNDPPLRQHDEAMLVAASHDLQFPRPGPLHGRRHLRSLVSAVANHPLDEGKQSARLLQERLGAVAILHIRRVDHHAQQQPERVGRIWRLRRRVFFERRPPF